MPHAVRVDDRCRAKAARDRLGALVAAADLVRIQVGTRADVPRGKAAVAAARAGMTFAQ